MLCTGLESILSIPVCAKTMDLIGYFRRIWGVVACWLKALPVGEEVAGSSPRALPYSMFWLPHDIPHKHDLDNTYYMENLYSSVA